MRRRWNVIVCSTMVAIGGFSSQVIAQTAPGPFARLAVLRPHDGKTTDFEAGYIRHLEWHKRNKDPFVWYGWSVWGGERQRWFVYATFGHSPNSLSNPVNPAEDEIDNILNVVPHAEFVSNAVYEFLPALSRGSGAPQAVLRVELTTVDVNLEGARAFEAAIASVQPGLKSETLWYRLVAGGKPPRYLRLRPRLNLAEVIESRTDQALPDKAIPHIRDLTVEVLSLRPNMSYNLQPPR